MAIAFDAGSSGNTGSGSSLTVAHTCTGSNRILWVMGFTTGNDTVTGITYNAVAMTQAVKKTTASSQTVYLYYLVAPATGANNIVLSDSGTNNLTIVGMSFTGASQTGVPDATSSNNNTGTTASVSLTTIADNCMVVAGYRFNTGTKTAGAGTTNVGGFANPAEGSYLTTAKTPAGVVTMTEDSTASTIWGGVIASFAPAAATASTRKLTLLSVG